MVARVSISSALLDELQAASAASPGAEICGLLYGRPDAIFMAEACANVAPRPDRAFELDPAALIAAHRRARAGGPAIIGHYHSHPSGRAEPSAIDAEAAPPDGALWLILTAGEAFGDSTAGRGQRVNVEYVSANPTGPMHVGH